jgi:ABC-2 type transport system ATP-binding protein
MRQRLGLAAAMLRRPRLLILDEPANGMDPAGIRDLRAALRRLAQDGLTVLLSSHDMAQVEEICDSVTVLHHGKVVFAGGLSVMREDAPEPVWRMRTSDDAAAMEAIWHVTGVRAAARDEGGLSVYAVQDRLGEYVLHLGRQGVAVHGLELEVTPLESLFFQLTAESAEPAEPGPAEPAPAGGRPVPQEAP